MAFLPFAGQIMEIAAVYVYYGHEIQLYSEYSQPRVGQKLSSYDLELFSCCCCNVFLVLR